MSRLALLTLVLVAGCTHAPHETPMAGDKRLVAILPFFDETGGSSFDGDEFGNILATEFVKVHGVRVVRPAHLRAEGKIVTVDDAVRAARKLGADTVVACGVTDYDPYDPPRIGVHVQMLRTEPRTLSTKDLDVLLQSATWKKGPLTMTRSGAPHAVAAFEQVYDARNEPPRRRMDFAVQSRWLQFVSTQILQRLHGT